MWQKCPICNGTGKHIEALERLLSDPCNTCEGKGIISELTGLPPKGVETFASPKYRNPDGTPVEGEWDNLKNKNPQQDKSYNIVEAYYNK